ncbi:MAG: hypothetical protein DSZ09_03240 [Sulfurovum sp.]|nr:MAG: hypothetical protein DSZ09_03240 [Sulfurovum sp.]
MYLPNTRLFFLSFFYIYCRKPQEKIISFSLSSYEPEIIPPVEETKKKEEPIEPEVVTKQEKIKPIIKKRITPNPVVKKPISKPLVKKIVRPKKKSVIKKNKTLKKKKKVKRNQTKHRGDKHKKKRVQTKVKRVAKSKKTVLVQKVNHVKKNQFLNQIRGKINRNKTYPRIAQRRRMQGTVNVRFTILPNGQVSNISLRGKKVFYTSARNAVKKAFPINVKHVPFSLPTTVNLTLHYQLR